MSGHWASCYIPSKVLCFFQYDDSNNQNYALIHPCSTSNHIADSILFERWQLEYKSVPSSVNQYTMIPALQAVEVKSFGDPVFVVEDSPGIVPLTSYTCPRISVVLPVNGCWASKFLSKE